MMSAAARIDHSTTAGSEATARISGDLTFDQVALLYQQAPSLLDLDSGIRKLDLTEVQRVDSAGLALLLEWQAAAGRNNVRLAMTQAPADLLSLAQLCEAQELLQLVARD